MDVGAGPGDGLDGSDSDEGELRRLLRYFEAVRTLQITRVREMSRMIVRALERKESLSWYLEFLSGCDAVEERRRVGKELLEQRRRGELRG